MPTKNINILVELNLSHKSASVNEIIQEVTHSLKSTTTDIIANKISITPLEDNYNTVLLDGTKV